MALLDPSRLPGTHRTRVFVGGSFVPTNRAILNVVADAVRMAGFVPLVADEYDLVDPHVDVHDVTLFLLHSCRIAVFDLSVLSGALIEIERCRDYGMSRVLVLYQHPFNRLWPDDPGAWQTTAMVKSLVAEQGEQFLVRPYVRPKDAAARAIRFLQALRRSAYGKLHHL